MVGDSEMRYKRKAPLRYNFGTPVSGKFKIIQIDDREVESQYGDAEILNVSVDGVCISTEFNIPELDRKEVLIEVGFKLNDAELAYNGRIVWKKELGRKTNYGLYICMTEQEKEQLIEELKVYAKKAIVKKQYEKE